MLGDAFGIGYVSADPTRTRQCFETADFLIKRNFIDHKMVYDTQCYEKSIFSYGFIST